jgi:hypothetical protein
MSTITGTIQELQMLLDVVKQVRTELDSLQQTTGTHSLQELGSGAKDTVMTAQQFTRILFRMNSILAHMGLPPEIEATIRKFQQLIFITRMLQQSMNLLMVSNPYTIIFGVMGLASAGFSLGDTIVGY